MVPGLMSVLVFTLQVGRHSIIKASILTMQVAVLRAPLQREAR
jgi:hypothetical protein